MREVEVLQILQGLEALDFSDAVGLHIPCRSSMRQQPSVQLNKRTNTSKWQRDEFWHAFQILKLSDAVAFEEERSHIPVSLQAFNFAEASAGDSPLLLGHGLGIKGDGTVRPQGPCSGESELR